MNVCRENIVIGIDTSAYTTSICAVNIDTMAIEFEKRKILDVPQGEKGLRQSMAVFQHLKNLPSFIEELFSKVDAKQIKSIAVANKPRPIKDSYMPVFFAGETYARVIAASLAVKLQTFSHQEGHIAAGIGTLATGIKSKEFLAIHLSGGTSEICLIENNNNKDFKIDLIGKTLDLHAGQFVDRIGVKMGLSFPAGPKLEQLAENSTTKLTIPSSVRGFDFSFSGALTRSERMLDEGYNICDIARAVEHTIAKTLEKIIKSAKQEYQIIDVLIVGGVASNSYIRNYLTKKLAHRAVQINTHFATPKYSVDNAYGIALLGVYNNYVGSY